MEEPSIWPNHAFRSEEVVDWKLTHGLGDCFCLVRSAGTDRAKIMGHRRVDAGMRHRRHCATTRIKPFRPLSRLVVEIPVEAVDEGHSFCNIKAETVDVRDKNQQRHQSLR